MIKYNDDNLIVGYIKQLLHSFNLPTIKVYKESNPIIKNNHYIKDGNVVRALNSKTSGITDNDFNVEFAYIFNRKMLNFSKNMRVNNHIYDSHTHSYLGDYLRFIRDYKHINLMSLYNCFTDEVINNLNYSFNVNDVNVSFNSKDESYVIYALPVKFFENYTIAIESSSAVEIMCGFYNKSLNSSLSAICNNTYQKIHNVRFKEPILYTKLKNIAVSEQYSKLEDSLKMFIKVPTSVSTSIVVLEGDYRHCNDFTFRTSSEAGSLTKCGRTVINYFPDIESGNYMSKDVKSMMQLLMINSGVSHPFSDRLVEYIVENAIMPLNTEYVEVSDNIQRLQEGLKERYDRFTENSQGQRVQLHKLIGLPKIKYKGIWEDEYNHIIYDIFSQTNKIDTTYDILGYGDKDIEKILKDVDIYLED